MSEIVQVDFKKVKADGIVMALELLLTEARAGKIFTLAVVTEETGRTSRRIYAGTDQTNIFRTIGIVSVLHSELVGLAEDLEFEGDDP
jgi:hypothetical protein